MPANASALTALIRQTNTYASVRDYLVTFTSDLAVTTANSVKMQASSLSQLTQATNQLTRSTSVNLLDLLHSISRIPPTQMIASDKCNQLASALLSMTTTVPYEDVQSARHTHRPMRHECPDGECHAELQRSKKSAQILL